MMKRKKSDVRRLRQLGTEVCVNRQKHPAISVGRGNDIKTKKRKTLPSTDCRKMLMHQGFVHRGCRFLNVSLHAAIFSLQFVCVCRNPQKKN